MWAQAFPPAPGYSTRPRARRATELTPEFSKRCKRWSPGDDRGGFALVFAEREDVIPVLGPLGGPDAGDGAQPRHVDRPKLRQCRQGGIGEHAVRRHLLECG